MRCNYSTGRCWPERAIVGKESCCDRAKGISNCPGEGHEAVAALAFHLREDDLIFPAYRDRALIYSRGMTVEEIARDFLAREGGPSLLGKKSARTFFFT